MGAALAVAVAGGLTACTSGPGDDAADTKPGDATAAAEPAPPGKFRTLPEPCGAVSRDTLEQMLPGAAAKAEKAEKAEGDDASGTPPPLGGEASLTYDTDRLVGCTWQSTTSLGSRRLTVEFERIVSYDPEISDDEQAELLFAERAEKAGIGSGHDSGRGEPAADGAEAEAGGEASSDGSGDGGGDGGGEKPAGAREGRSEEPGSDASPDDEKAEDGSELASPSPDLSLPPRTLDGIGDAAFIDDRLKTAADGRGSQRSITLVFRAANVLVTVEYSQSIADAHRTPDSAELQDHAQNLARQLAEQFTDS